MTFNLSVDAPNPLLLRPRTSWLPQEVSEISLSLTDENHHTTGYLTIGTFINFGRYELIQLLGRGTFGAVVLAHCHATRQRRAVKFLNFNRDGFEEVRTYNMLYEKPDLTKIPRIDNVFRIFHNGVPYICIAMEPLGPNLYKTVYNCGSFSIPFATIVMRNVLEGFQYLHETVGIAHLDVSPSNIVFRDHFELGRGNHPQSAYIRIIDFNSCHRHGTFDTRCRYISAYRAPEVCLQLHYTCTADIFALGSLAFFIVQGQDFFPNDDMATDMELINAHARYLGAIPMQMLAESKRAFVQRSADGSGYILVDSDLPKVKETRILENFFNRENVDEFHYGQLIRACYTLDYTNRPKAAKLLFINPIFQRHREHVPEVAPFIHRPTQYPLCSIPNKTPDWATSFPHFIPPSKAPPTHGLIPVPVGYVLNKVKDEWKKCRGFDSPCTVQNAAGPSHTDQTNAHVGRVVENRPLNSFPSDPVQSQTNYPYAYAQNAMPINHQPYQFYPPMMPAQPYPYAAQFEHPAHMYNPATAQFNAQPYPYHTFYAPLACMRDPSSTQVLTQPYAYHQYHYTVHYTPAACLREAPTVHFVPHTYPYQFAPTAVPVHPQPYPYTAQHASIQLVPHLVDANTLQPLAQPLPQRVADITAWSQEYRERFNLPPPTLVHSPYFSFHTPAVNATNARAYAQHTNPTH